MLMDSIYVCKKPRQITLFNLIMNVLQALHKLFLFMAETEFKDEVAKELN